MPTGKPNHKFVAKKTAILHERPGKGDDGHDHRKGVLIFGDEVEAFDDCENGRRKVQFRDEIGWVDEQALGNQRTLECYFIDVGTGDSTFIVTPGGKKILIDGGLNQRALGFLAWKFRLDKQSAPLTIDLLVLSHADDDHLGGLAPIIAHPRIHVRRVIHSGIATYDDEKHPLGATSQAAGNTYLTTRHDALTDLSPSQLSPGYQQFYYSLDRERTSYQAVDSTTPDIDIGDPSVRIEVLGPRLVPHPRTDAPCLPWLGNASKTINGHSVVLRLIHGDVAMLLPGDINGAGSRHLLEDPRFRDRMPAHVFKAPHHGSHDFASELLHGVRPQVAVISSGDDRDHGHPRAAFLGAVGRHTRSEHPLVFSTEIAANFAEVRLPESEDEIDVAAGGFARARQLFKRRLHGMINVRSDGRRIFAARRVAASYAWEAYEPAPAAAMPEDE